MKIRRQTSSAAANLHVNLEMFAFFVFWNVLEERRLIVEAFVASESEKKSIPIVCILSFNYFCSLNSAHKSKRQKKKNKKAAYELHLYGLSP